ncbi:MAG: phosphatase PAP2 family protein [Flavobacteriaceae bacterium]
MRKYCLLFLIITGTVRSQTGDSQNEIQTERTIEGMGHFLHLALPAAAGLSTVIVGDKKGSWQFLKSFSANLAATYTLKYAFNKPRPEGALDGLAFPSGHTSVAFNSAAFIQKRYGLKYGIPAYILAGFVGYSRIEGLNDRHDGWDVLGGVAVGVGSAYLFTTDYKKQRMDLTFTRVEGHYMVGFSYKF